MAILAAYAQNTSYAHQFVMSVQVECATLTDTSAAWVDLGFIAALKLRVGGQALAHVLMNITSVASSVHVWVDTPGQLGRLLDAWRCRFPDLILGSTLDTLIVCRPAVMCVCYVHVEAWTRDTAIMTLQPDFTQCMFDGNSVAVTPRCLLALHTNTSVHRPMSTNVWVSMESGLQVAGETTGRAKPTVTPPDMGGQIWSMVTQYGCINVSTNSTQDAKYCIPRTPKPAGRWGWTGDARCLLAYLDNPLDEVELECALYVYVERMYVESRVGDEVTVRPSREVDALQRLIALLGTGDARPDFLVVRVDAPVHAPSGVTLAHAPVGCSLSGFVWWHPSCVRRGSAFFSTVNPRVHPGHLPVTG
jgi:hypothetical protein